MKKSQSRESSSSSSSELGRLHNVNYKEFHKIEQPKTNIVSIVQRKLRGNPDCSTITKPTSFATSPTQGKKAMKLSSSDSPSTSDSNTRTNTTKSHIKSVQISQNVKDTKPKTKILQTSEKKKQSLKHTSDSKHSGKDFQKSVLSNLPENEKGKTQAVRTSANSRGRGRGKPSKLQRAKSIYSSYFDKCYKLPPNTKPMSHINKKHGEKVSQISKSKAGRQVSEVNKQMSLSKNDSVSKQKPYGRSLSSSDSDSSNDDKLTIQKQKEEKTSCDQQKRFIRSTGTGVISAEREKITKEQIEKKLKDFEKREKEGKLPNVTDVVDKIETFKKFHNPETGRSIQICSPGRNVKRRVKLNKVRATKPISKEIEGPVIRKESNAEQD